MCVYVWVCLCVYTCVHACAYVPTPFAYVYVLRSVHSNTYRSKCFFYDYVGRCILNTLSNEELECNTERKPLINNITVRKPKQKVSHKHVPKQRQTKHVRKVFHYKKRTSLFPVLNHAYS